LIKGAITTDSNQGTVIIDIDIKSLSIWVKIFLTDDHFVLDIAIDKHSLDLFLSCASAVGIENQSDWLAISLIVVHPTLSDQLETR